MLHTDIIDIKQKKLSIKDAEKFIASANYGASIIFTGTVRNQNNNKNYKYNHKKLLHDPFKKGKQIN